MSNIQQQDQATTLTTTTNGDESLFYPTSGSILATTTLPPQLPTTLADQLLYEKYKLKWDEASLEEKMVALNLETQKQLLNEFMLQKTRIQNVQLAYPTEIPYRAPKLKGQRNRDLYKTALCNFWSAGVPCRFGDRCWFAHGLNELRIARFVYPSLHPYDYEIRMNPVNTPTHKQHFFNLEQNYPMANAMQLTPRTITPMGQTVPIGYERKIRCASPVFENANSKNSRGIVRVSGGDSGIGSAGTNNSPEANSGYRANLGVTTYQSSPIHETPTTSYDTFMPPSNFFRPFDALTNREPTDFSNSRAYNHWSNMETVQSNSLQIGSDLEQVTWWPDTTNMCNPYIDHPNQTI